MREVNISPLSQYPQWTGHRDRRGIPIYVFVIKNLNSKNMAAYTSNASSSTTSATHKSSSVPPRLLRLFALYENMVRFVLPLCSSLPRPNPETPIVSTTNIVDISGVGLKQFWNLKGHMQDASVLATAHYPETLDKIYVRSRPFPLPQQPGTNISHLDHRCTRLLPHGLGLDKALVRPCHHLQNLHPLLFRS